MALIPLTVQVRRLLYRLIWRPMPLNKSVVPVETAPPQGPPLHYSAASNTSVNMCL